jgi:hypothetical protein
MTRHHVAGMTLDLTDAETAALAKHLRQALDYARYPYAPRLDPLKAILAKPNHRRHAPNCGHRFRPAQRRA